MKKTRVKVTDRTGEAKKSLKSEMWIAMKKSAMTVEAKVIVKTPVISSNLKGSITHRVTDGPFKIRGFVGTNVEYAERVEFGGFKKAPHGYLRPGLYESEAAINKFHAQALRNLEREYKR